MERILGKRRNTDFRNKVVREFQRNSEDPSLHSKISRATSCFSFSLVALLEVVIMVIFTTLVILIWFLATKEAHNSVSQISKQQREQCINCVKANTASVFGLNNASAVHLANLVAFSSPRHSFSSYSALENQVSQVLFPVFATQQYVSHVLFMVGNGLFINYHSNLSGSFILFSNTTDSEDNGVRTWYDEAIDVATGTERGNVMPVNAFSFQKTSWFHEALSSDHGLSILGTSFTEPKELLIFFMASLKNSSKPDISNAVVGLGATSRAIRSLIMHCSNVGAYMYLATDDGYLIVQEGEPDYTNNVPGSTLIKATQSSSLVISQVAQYLENTTSRLGNQGISFFEVKIHDSKYVVDATQVQVSGRSLVVVVITPIQSFWHSIVASSHRTMLLLVILLVFMLVRTVFFICSLTRAIAKEKQLCATLIQQFNAVKKAEKASSHKSIALAQMSHDFRTSVATIMALIDASLPYTTLVSELKTCATDLMGMLNATLDSSTIEAGKQQLEEIDFNIIDTLEEVVDMFFVLALQKGIEVVLDLTDEFVGRELWVTGDAGKLKRILSNLIGNGLKFTTEGHVVLRFWASKAVSKRSYDRNPEKGQVITQLCGGMFKYLFEENNIYRTLYAPSNSQADDNYIELHFEVDDTGKGIQKDIRHSVFEDYVRGGRDDAPKQDGIGLGLGIVRSLVHLMNGDIEIVDKDEPGKHGTCFRFNLFFKRAKEKTPLVRSKNEEPQWCADKLDASLLLKSSSSSGRFYTKGKKLVFNSKRFTSSTQSSPISENIHVLILMNGETNKVILKNWLKNKGLCVKMLNRWEEISLIVESLSGGSNLRSSSSFTSEIVSQELYSSNKNSEQFEKNGSDFYLMLIIDIGIVSDDFEAFSPVLNNVFLRTQILNYKVVWLATTNNLTITMDQIRTTVPCDLILYKPIHGSRLNAIWKVLLEVTGHKSRSQESKSSGNVQSGNGAAFTNQLSCSSSFTNFSKQSETMFIEGKVLDSDKPLLGKNILIAEDNIILQKLAKSLIGKLGATVECVDNGADAVLLVSERLKNSTQKSYKPEISEEVLILATIFLPFDIIFMDCEMPIMNGYEATRKIREEERQYGCHIPIVALTAHAMPEEEIKCLQAGMDFHLTKPLNIDSLLNVIEKVFS